jgi:hypothetical protein
MRWNPEDYAQNSDAQLKWARELRSNLDLQGTEAVLDVGCGDGKITADFAQALPQGHSASRYAERFEPDKHRGLPLPRLSDRGSSEKADKQGQRLGSWIINWYRHFNHSLSESSLAAESNAIHVRILQVLPLSITNPLTEMFQY